MCFWLSHQVCIEKAVRDVNSLHTSASVMPSALEWGQVMVEMRYAAINPADFYTLRFGTYGYEPAAFPYTCGHDGIGVVAKVTVIDRSNAKTGLERRRVRASLPFPKATGSFLSNRSSAHGERTSSLVPRSS